MTPAPNPKDKQPTDQSPSDAAEFVFTGTVGKVTAASKSAPAAATVKVNQVIRAPEVLRHAAGQDVTVYSKSKLSAGQQSTFYTRGLVFGDTISVQSIREENIAMGAAAAMAPANADPVKNHDAHRAQERFAQADLVVSGKVTSVRVAESPAPAAPAAFGAAAAGPAGRISEHDPHWQDAVVDVTKVHKGGRAPQKVVIRFPGSTDVMWHRAPKFHPGQEGVFLLHKNEPKAQAKGMAAAPAEEAPYTALDPADFHPADDLHAVAPLIGAHNN
jgi:hypothetical protein